jgi:hypothetical protein
VTAGLNTVGFSVTRTDNQNISNNPRKLSFDAMIPKVNRKEPITDCRKALITSIL